MGVQIPNFPDPFQRIPQKNLQRNHTHGQVRFPGVVKSLSLIRAANLQFDFEKSECEIDFQQDFFRKAPIFPQIRLFLLIFAYIEHGNFSAPSP
jgi:hypothetical protein